MYRYLPETAGLRLEAIERLFQDPYPEGMPTSVVSEGGGSSDAMAPAPSEATSLLPPGYGDRGKWRARASGSAPSASEEAL